MKMRGWLAAIALVLAVNVFVLARVAANRRGEPETTMTLTERELPTVYVYPESESSAVSLRFNVEHFSPWLRSSIRESELDPLAWLDAGKLAAVGFRVPPPSCADEAYIQMQKQLPREVFAVLEFGGPAGERYRRRLAERFSFSMQERSEAKPLSASDGSERPFAEREFRFGSRLFIVDVGTDPAALRRQYPDGHVHLIAPAKVHAFMQRNYPSTGCEVRGSLSLLIDEVNVPRRLHSRLPIAQPGDEGGWSREHAPRYEVVLSSGNRHEPWIRDIHPVRRGM